MFVSHAYFYSFSFFSDNIHFSMSIVNYADHNHSGFREIIIKLSLYFDLESFSSIPSNKHIWRREFGLTPVFLDIFLIAPLICYDVFIKAPPYIVLNLPPYSS